MSLIINVALSFRVNTLIDSKNDKTEVRLARGQCQKVVLYKYIPNLLKITIQCPKLKEQFVSSKY